MSLRIGTCLFSFYKTLFIYFYFRLCCVFVVACGLSLAAASGGYSSFWCAGFSLQWLLLLRSMGSRHTGFSSCSTRAKQLQCTGSRAHMLQQLWLMGSRAQAQQLWHMSLVAPQHVGSSRTSSCGARAQLLRSTWDLPRPGIEPVSSAFAGGFSTTAPPGKSQEPVLTVLTSQNIQQNSASPIDELTIFS